MSMPGIGKILCYLILYEIGTIERFRTPHRFASYCTLVPSTHQSAKRIWHGHTGRRGNLSLKWAFTEAAHTAVRKDPALGAYYQSLSRRRGKGIAIIAVARKLSVGVWHILKKETPYRYKGMSKHHLGKPVVILGR